MSFLGRIRARNRLSKYLLPTGALVIAAGGYFLWEYGRRDGAIASNASEEDASVASTTESGQDEEVPGDNLEAEVAENGEEDIEPLQDAALFLEYSWAEYKSLSPCFRPIVEASLLGKVLSSFGAAIKEGKITKLLSEEPELHAVFLECWERGSFEHLRCHDTIVSLVKNTPLPREVGQDTEENTGVPSGGSGGAFGTPDTEQSERAQLTTRSAASAVQTSTDFPGSGGVQETVFEGLKTGEALVITGGNFKQVTGDSWEINYSSDHHRQVAEWFSPTDYRLTHNDISRKRAENTGMWLLNSESFKKWQTDPSCRVLWCPGIPGVGKTTIASLVIDYLRQHRSETIAVGFAYFNYKLQDQQNTTMVLGCLSRQLYECYEGDGTSSSFEDLYSANERDYSRPPAHGLHAAISKTCQHFVRYYVVLDALDEYLENYNIDDLRQLLKAVTSLGNMIKLVVTSRFLHGMEELFAEFGASKEEIVADDEDMTTYLKSRIGMAGFRFDVSAELSQEIVKKVKEAASGRFLMAELHMNTLREQLNRGSLRKALVNLPKGIDATYERVLQHMKTYPDSHRELAMMTLTLVSRTKRRLSVREVQHALATEPGLEGIELEDHVTSISIISSLCAGLVIVRDRSVIFVHFTAQDFFDNLDIRNKYFPGAEESIFKICLAYLSLPLCIVALQGVSRYSASYLIPFYDYAARNLALHGQEEAASKELDIFLTSSDTAPHICCIQLLASFTFHYHDSDSSPTATISPIFLAVYYNRITLLLGLLSSLEEVPLTSKGRTPLMYAAHLGRTACLEAMLGWLHARSGAIGSGLPSDPQAAREVFLIGHINERDAAGYTALTHACRQGHEEATALLLNYEGIDVNLADINGRTPLTHAAEEGLEEVVGLLLNYEGININLADDEGMTPLNRAAGEGHEGVVGLLLNHEGINVNLADGFTCGWTPLIRAACFFEETVVKYLLCHPKIQVNRQDITGATALTRTIVNWDGSPRSDADAAKQIIQLLLSQDDLDVNLPDKHGCTPLFYAQRAVEDDQRWEGVCNLLRAKGMVAVFDWSCIFHDSLFPQLFL